MYLSQNHRMVEIQRDIWRSSGPTPLLKQIAQDNFQMDLEYLLGQRLCNFSCQPGQCSVI